MRACTVLSWLVLCALFVPLCEPTADGDTLVTMMGKWGVPRPPNWTGDDPCAFNWEGVQCDDNSQVSHLKLTNKGLRGDIPVEISSLKGLVNLDLSNVKTTSGVWNRITGDLSGLSGLSNLQSLNLTFNVLEGDFPRSVLDFTALTDLRLDNCQLTGAFPQGLSKLSKLQYLYLGNNTMTGKIPPELGSLTDLIELSLWNIQFNSIIPSEFGALSNLRYLTLHDCGLIGGLPSEFENLKSLEKMYLYENQMTGPIPDTWKNLEKLQDLRLYGNFFTKQFPLWIQDSSSLSYVDLSYNNLYGPVANIASKNLSTLNIACNFFSGPEPSSTTISNFTDAQNCFGKDFEADNRSFCKNFYNCFLFNKSVLSTGSCPDCPIPQILSNDTTCICLQASDLSGNGNKSKTGIIIGVVVGVIVIVLLGVLVFLAYKRCRYAQRMDLEMTENSKYVDKFTGQEPFESWEVPKGAQRFSFLELGRATSGFDSNHQIGVGGFGKVFYGKLDNGKEVAIKRASSASMQGRAEFRNEVTLLSRLHHRNLVRLEGFCEDNDLQILVYEYVPNGNLHRHLFQRVDNQFSWLRRLDIAVGIAQGLTYLHSSADPPVIHRDVKPSNVLLDNNMVAKVADFGISKATMEFETHISTTPAGTAGYIDPQYFLRKQLTTASDVYGFGVVLLELITGQKAIDANREEESNIVEWVKMKMKADGLESIVDPRIREECPLPIFRIVTELAMSCASFYKNDRPQMKEVLTVLDQCLRSTCPSPAALTEKHHSMSIQMLEDEEEEASGGGRVGDLTFSSTLSASKSAFKGAALMPR